MSNINVNEMEESVEVAKSFSPPDSLDINYDESSTEAEATSNKNRSFCSFKNNVLFMGVFALAAATGVVIGFASSSASAAKQASIQMMQAAANANAKASKTTTKASKAPTNDCEDMVGWWIWEEDVFASEIVAVTQPAPEVWMPYDSCTFEMEMQLDECTVTMPAYMHDGVISMQGAINEGALLAGAINLDDWSYSFTMTNYNNIYTGLMYGWVEVGEGA